MIHSILLRGIKRNRISDMKKKIIINGSRIHDVGYRLALLQYAKEYRFLSFEAINTLDDEKECVCIYVEGDENKITEFVSKVHRTIPEVALVNAITDEYYEGEILPISVFSQDLQMEQMTKAVPILVEMRDLQKETLEKQDKALNLHHQTLDLQHQTLDLQHDTISEIKGLREDFRFTFDNRLKKIEDTLQMIITALEQAKILG